MAVAFDTLKFTQRLEQVGVGREQAIAHAELARDMIIADSATKADLQSVKTELQGALRELELRMTIKLGAIAAAAVAIVGALQKVL
jgi:hypothetical protein